MHTESYALRLCVQMLVIFRLGSARVCVFGIAFAEDVCVCVWWKHAALAQVGGYIYGNDMLGGHGLCFVCLFAVCWVRTVWSGVK